MKRYVVLAVIFCIMLAAVSACYADSQSCDLTLAISSDTPVLCYITGEPYKIEATITNQAENELKLDKLSVSWQYADSTTDVNPQGNLPATVAAGASASVVFPVTFPDNVANRKVTLCGKLEYSINGKKSTLQTDTAVVLSPQCEITLLPGRTILDPKTDTQRIGMSIINHSKNKLEGKISLTTSPGLKATPDTLDAQIEPQGLDAFVFSVNTQKKLAPGHYAVFINVNGKQEDWAAIDIPVLAYKAPAKITIDGKLDDWKDPATVNIAKLISVNGNTGNYESAGSGKFYYDDSNFYMAFELDSVKSVKVGFDPLINGAMAAGGGYKDDDYEYTFAETNNNVEATRSKAPNGKSLGTKNDVKIVLASSGAKRIYEIAIPWSELAPFKPAKDAKFALAVQLNKIDGSSVEWGGGLADKVDPRRFVPLVLAE